MATYYQEVCDKRKCEYRDRALQIELKIIRDIEMKRQAEFSRRYTDMCNEFSKMMDSYMKQIHAYGETIDDINKD